MIYVESVQNIYCYSNLTVAAAEETKNLNIKRVVCLKNIM